MNNFIGRWFSSARRRASYLDLMDMDQRLLDDIGISRGELADLAANPDRARRGKTERG